LISLQLVVKIHLNKLFLIVLVNSNNTGHKLYEQRKWLSKAETEGIFIVGCGLFLNLCLSCSFRKP